MSKSSAQQLIKDEQKIMDVLQQNANESIEMIAKNAGFLDRKSGVLLKNSKKKKPSGLHRDLRR